MSSAQKVQKKKSQTPVEAIPLNDEQVATYLRRNPNFFMNNERTLLDLTLPGVNGANIASFGQFQAVKLKEEVGKLKERNQLLIQTSLQNLESEKQIHTLVLKLLAATTKKELISTLENYVVKELGLYTLQFVESSKENAKELNRLVGEGHKVKLRTLFKTTHREIYGEDGENVASDALLRLENEEVFFGIIALGSTREDRFHEGQGSELLEFLCGILTHCMGSLTTKVKPAKAKPKKK